MNILAELRQRLEDALQGIVPETRTFADMLRVAQDPKFGDYQANFAMPLSKVLKKPPREVATDILAKWKLEDLCQPPEIAGPGFINLRLRDDWLETQTNQAYADPRDGVDPVAQPKTYVLDYSSPNVAKPMHVGHLRSTVIGDALYRILTFLGHKVIGDNHVGDWGTQFGMIIFGYKHFRDETALQANLVTELARLYRLVNQLSDYHEERAKLPKLDQLLAEKLAEFDKPTPLGADEKQIQKQRKKLAEEVEKIRQDIASGRKKLSTVEASPPLKAFADQYPEIATQARLETARLHAGDPENTALWNRFVPACLQAIQQVYDRLGVRFDVVYGESYYNPMLADVVSDLQQRGMAVESAGAQCVFLPGFEAPFIVRKSDQAYTYATTDLATIRYRKEQLGADGMLYVVDARQSDHFNQLFATARQWGYDNIEFQHISFGTILGPDNKPYKTRSGDTVGLESLLDEAIEQAYRVVESSSLSEGDDRPKMAEATMRAVAEVVGLGGIKYADLKHNRDSDYIFSWDKMLAKNGDTATYMQYAYARVCGIIRKAEVDRAALRSMTGTIRITHPTERSLMLQLNRFAEILHSTGAEYRPNFLTDYLFSTANAFSSFYDACPVKDAPTPEVRISRLRLADFTARVLHRGLSMLGIKTIEQM